MRIRVVMKEIIAHRLGDQSRHLSPARSVEVGDRKSVVDPRERGKTGAKAGKIHRARCYSGSSEPRDGHVNPSAGEREGSPSHLRRGFLAVCAARNDTTDRASRFARPNEGAGKSALILARPLDSDGLASGVGGPPGILAPLQ